MATCRSCGAEIRWAKTETGQNIPVNPEADFGGNIELHRGDNDVIYATVVDAVPHEPRYISHFATCLNAAGHRKERR